MLDFERASDSSSTPPVPVGPPNDFLGKIFLNDVGLRAGWRLCLYGLFWITLSYLLQFIIIGFFGFTADTFSPQSILREDLTSFIAAFCSALLMAKLERRPVDIYGLPRAQTFGKSFWQGWLLGLVEVTLLISLIAGFGGYSFGSLSLHGMEVIRWGAVWFVAFVSVGLSEEYLFRGYTQYTLAQMVGFWPAAALLSVLFGVVHLQNRGEGFVGAAGIVAAWVVFSFYPRRSRHLLPAVGLSVMFFFCEAFFYFLSQMWWLLSPHPSVATLHGQD